MRTIKFRGKTELTGEWVYGFFTMGIYVHVEHPDKDERIVPRYLIDDGLLNDVIPETIGQFTGLTDKDGKEIFEGDCLLSEENAEVFEVVYDAPRFCFKDNDFGFRFLNHPENFAVIGNAHDDPELIEKGGEA